jgi:hypothetical protein
MGKAINVLTPTQGFTNTEIITVQVNITEGSTTLSSRFYTFHNSQFCAYLDDYTQTIASIHFGEHVLTISNGDFTSFNYNGSAVNYPSEIVSNLVSAIGDLTV